MIDIILALLATVSITTGHAAYYSRNVMERTVEIRLAGWPEKPLTGEQITGCIGFMAVAD
jgi:hypothetical protein